MEKFKPRKSVKRFVCETLIGAFISTLILTLIVVFTIRKNRNVCNCTYTFLFWIYFSPCMGK